MDDKSYRICQSCSMPLKKDEKGGGTNADGSHSRMFCSKCFENGAFIHPDMTVDEMKLFVKGTLIKMGFPGFLAILFTRKIPRLERWRNSVSG